MTRNTGVTDRAALRLGGCPSSGAWPSAGFRIAHGDLPAADARAALQFISEHPPIRRLANEAANVASLGRCFRLSEEWTSAMVAWYMEGAS